MDYDQPAARATCRVSSQVAVGWMTEIGNA
jgi:hypothetical protein